MYSFSEGKDQFKLEHTFPTNYAILDLHFPPNNKEPEVKKCFWTANSTGSLACYIFHDKDMLIQNCKVSQVWDREILALSLTFHPHNSRILCVTLSDGTVVLCRLNKELDEVKSTLNIKPHTLETWTSAFNISGDTLFSGADDAVLQKVKIPELHLDAIDADEELESMTPHDEWMNRRLHGAGVTAILEIADSLILTGSYDDHVRLINTQSRPKLLAEEHLGGGVWRLKLIQVGAGSNGAKEYDILASCMHAGARIVRITVGEKPGITITARFEENESMNYGSGFVSSNSDYTILSTSFYDRKLCLSKYRAEAFGSTTQHHR